jgi:hypothetical protein
MQMIISSMNTHLSRDQKGSRDSVTAASQVFGSQPVPKHRGLEYLIVPVGHILK